ncbi:MAG TPA: hypothetical protein PJ982_17915 [Lacipirellulaceae bacterium]|nr:hypothetical protein [Lacipirellulaceae bacterium]
MPAPTKQPPTFIDPQRLYTLAGFMAASGFNFSRMRELRIKGIDLPRLRVGKRVFIEGHAAIEYIRKAAEQ